jgi:hypothetical protein
VLPSRRSSSARLHLKEFFIHTGGTVVHCWLALPARRRRRPWLRHGRSRTAVPNSRGYEAGSSPACTARTMRPGLPRAWSSSPLQASAAHHCTLPTTEHLPPPLLMHLRPARRKGCTVRACARPGANWSGGYCTDYRPRPQLPADGNGARGKAFDLVGESLSTPMEKEPYQRGSYNHKHSLYRCGTLHYLHKISTNFYWGCEIFKSLFSDATSQNCLK